MRDRFFHLHLVSDATGETLMRVARASTSQYSGAQAVEHVHPLIRNEQQMDRILQRIEDEPGIVLYTLVNPHLAQRLEAHCQALPVPVCNILGPVFDLFQNYLGTEQNGQAGAQHHINSDYLSRLEAMNFAMAHDDGQSQHSLHEADIILLGISRTSKTPTSIYLAQRGLRVANIPLVPDLPVAAPIEQFDQPMKIGLIASPGHIMQVRQNRMLGLSETDADNHYLDRNVIKREIAYTKKLCQQNQWPILDITRKSIEETAAEIFKNYQRHRRARRQATSY